MPAGPEDDRSSTVQAALLELVTGLLPQHSAEVHGLPSLSSEQQQQQRQGSAGASPASPLSPDGVKFLSHGSGNLTPPAPALVQQQQKQEGFTAVAVAGPAVLAAAKAGSSQTAGHAQLPDDAAGGAAGSPPDIAGDASDDGRTQEDGQPAIHASELYAAVKPTGTEAELQGELPVLRPTLRRYQRRAAGWMVAREQGRHVTAGCRVAIWSCRLFDRLLCKLSAQQHSVRLRHGCTSPGKVLKGIDCAPEMPSSVLLSCALHRWAAIAACGATVAT